MQAVWPTSSAQPGEGTRDERQRHWERKAWMATESRVRNTFPAPRRGGRRTSEGVVASRLSGRPRLLEKERMS